MLKTLLLTSTLAIAAFGVLHAQQVKKPVLKGETQKDFRRPPPEPRPPIPQDTTKRKPPVARVRRIRDIADTMSRATRLRILTDATYLPSYTPIASHRAQWSGQTEPENSMEAIIHVSNMDEVDIIELDIKKSSDDTVYVMHDNYLQRTTDFLDKYRGTGTGATDPPDPYGHYNNYTWAQVKRLTLKMPDFSYTDRVVPPFRQVLRYVKNSTNKLINLDIGDTVVLRKTWEIVQQEDAFDVCIFKTSQFTVDVYRSRLYDRLPAAQKAKVIFFPMIPLANAMSVYQSWENSGLAKGYEMGYRKGITEETALLDVVDAIHARRRVRVHVFNTLPDSYRGRYFGDRNINQCCNETYDSRGDWQYLLQPRPTTLGADGYIITDDPVTLSNFVNR